MSNSVMKFQTLPGAEALMVATTVDDVEQQERVVDLVMSRVPPVDTEEVLRALGLWR